MIGRVSATRAVRVTRHRTGGVARARDVLAVEEPLEIRVAWRDARGHASVERLAVTMRTPGEDFDLVAGFLYGEAVVRAPEELLELTYCRDTEEQEYNVVEARLRPGASLDLERLRRNVYVSSSCGVCGKASLDAVAAHGCSPLPDDGLVVPERVLAQLPERLLESQRVFDRTGGLHAAGVFDSEGGLRAVREDVGRHNAVDKVVGGLFLARDLPVDTAVLVVSGRASFEIVQKALMARLPVLVAVGAPSSLAVDLARRFGQTLIGFARDGGFNVYVGEQRVGP